MKQYTCNQCGKQLGAEERNTVKVKNKFNHQFTLHYCGDCATGMWPTRKSYFSWTITRPR